MLTEPSGAEDVILAQPAEAEPHSPKRANRGLPIIAGIIFMLLTFVAGLSLGFNIGLWRAKAESIPLAVSATTSNSGQAEERAASASTVEALN